ncbi:hypothetical protein ACWDOP_14905 [Nocardia sp. NPDC003693]
MATDAHFGRAHGLLAAMAFTVALAGIALAGAGPAHAEPGGRGHRDTTGQHHVDRQGIHHRDSNPGMQDEHDDARRDYYNEAYGKPGAGVGVERRGGSNSATWNRTARGDGSGWVVCPRLSRTCG